MLKYGYAAAPIVALSATCARAESIGGYKGLAGLIALFVIGFLVLSALLILGAKRLLGTGAAFVSAALLLGILIYLLNAI